MAILDIKFTKFDNRPWGFRLAGGSDFPQPLTVIRVSEESLAECMGLKVGDVILKLNDHSVADLSHGQAHEALTLAGNNFVLTVQRAEDPTKLPDIPLEDLVPYAIPLDSLPPLENLEEKLKKPNKVSEENVNGEEEPLTNGINGELGEEKEEVEPEKPTDENSERIANKNLTDEEIADLILEEEEILTEKGLLGVNFKKLRPRVTVLKESKVIEALQDESLEEPKIMQERKRTTTFLQKPERPPPAPKKPKEEPPSNVEPYRVIIKKQPKKSVTEKLLEQGLIQPEDVKTPESRSEVTPFPDEPEILTDLEDIEPYCEDCLIVYQVAEDGEQDEDPMDLFRSEVADNEEILEIGEIVLSKGVVELGSEEGSGGRDFLKTELEDKGDFHIGDVSQIWKNDGSPIQNFPTTSFSYTENEVKPWKRKRETKRRLGLKSSCRKTRYFERQLVKLVASTRGCRKSKLFKRGGYFSRTLSRFYNSTINTIETILTSQLKFKFSKAREIQNCKNSGISPTDRRLSFIPTVLSENLTAKIGVDFTKFIAYASVPIVSCLALYFYS